MSNDLIVAWFNVPGEDGSKASKTHLTMNGKPICGARLRAGMELQFIGYLETASMHIECERCMAVAPDGFYYVVGTRCHAAQRKPRVTSYGPFASEAHARAWQKYQGVMHFTIAPVRVGQFIRVQSGVEAKDAARLAKRAARAGDGVIVARVETEA